MVRRVSLSIAGFLCGLLALAAFFILAYASRRAPHVNGVVLNLMSMAGLVVSEPSYISELKPASIFSFNDANALLWLHVSAFGLSVIGAGLALWAEWRREASIYSSAGFVVATVGIWLLSPAAGVSTQLLGGALLLGIRRVRAVET